MTAIEQFLAHKKLSLNTQISYKCDLEQFERVIAGDIDSDRLRLYQNFLAGFKPSVQRRKVSAVNQFLYYLYENGQIGDYHRLKLSLYQPQPELNYQRLDLAVLQRKTVHKDGQLIALLMAHLGLKPAELMVLESADCDLELRVVTVRNRRNKRVLRLPDLFLPYLESRLSAFYLFDKGGKPYSRQWFFNQLNLFLSDLGLEQLTAQKLRDQYILAQLATGLSLSQLAQQLGLKSVVTLEKYVRK